MKEKYKILREAMPDKGKAGLAVARFGCVMGSEVIAPGNEPIKFAVDEGDGGDLNGEEFLAKPFRFLSQTLTPYRFFDFTREGVLKSGVPLFDGLTVYANHNADVNQWKGYTQKPVWDSENVPNGINGLMVLDRTIDANLTRGVEIGALKSASVTIWFEFERSHPDLRNFYDYLGEEVEGEIVRFIVTKLVRAAEVSIVWEGEDPYAKALEAGIRDQGSGASPVEFPEGNPIQQGKEENANHNHGGEVMKLSQKILKMLGIEPPSDGEVSPESLETAVEGKLAKAAQEIESLKPDAAIGKKHLEVLREKAATAYKALKGDNAKESFIENVIQKADLETAQAMLDEYQQGIDKAAPLTCPKCGTKLIRQSSVPESQTQKGSDKRAEDYKIG